MPLAQWLLSLAWPLARRVLVQLGVGFVTYEAVSTAIDSMLDMSRSAYESGDSNVLVFLAIAGVPKVFGIIAGGISARVAFLASKKLQVK